MVVPLYYHTETNATHVTLFHRQDEGRDCGLACAEIVLRSYYQRNTTAPYFQQCDPNFIDSLRYVQTGSSTSTAGCNPPVIADRNWGVNPDCLTKELNDYAVLKRGPLASSMFRLVECTSQDDLASWLIYNIYSGKVAPCVVVKDWIHWVVVYGCDVRGLLQKPRPCPGKPYDVEAFYIYDPSPDAKYVYKGEVVGYCSISGCTPSNPCFHKDDDLCGRGLIEDLNTQDRIQYINWGLMHRRVSDKYWRRMELTGIRHAGTTWDQRYLAVVDAETSLPNCNRSNRLPKPDFMTCIGKPSPTDRCLLSGKLIGCEKAKEASMEGLRRIGFLPEINGSYRNGTENAPKTWQALLKGASAMRAHLVQPPDAPAYEQMDIDFSYYLVEMEITGPSDCFNTGDVPAVVMVNACESEMLDVSAVKLPQQKAPQTTPRIRSIVITDRNEMYRAMVDATTHSRPILPRKPIAPTSSDRIKLKKDDIPDPREFPDNFKLVWQPAPGSLSPYTPFYQVTLQLQNKGYENEVLYVPAYFTRGSWFELFEPLDKRADPVDLTPFFVYSDKNRG